LSSPAKKSNPLPFMENSIVGIIALGLIAYLIFTIIRPEKF
jgi:K+-transporting ATPase KdpF subunit